MERRVGLRIGVLIVAGFLGSGGGAWSQEDRELAVSSGAFDVLNGTEGVEGGVEYRFPGRLVPRLPKGFQEIQPMAGLMATSRGSLYTYGGFRWELSLGTTWSIVPNFAVGLYEDGDGKDLGGVVEFRSSLEVAYRRPRGSRIGLAFYHLSNAGIYDQNPGSESLIVTFSLPLGQGGGD